MLSLLQQEDSLLIGVQPVGGGTGQVEDASPAGQRPVQQVQDGPGVVGQVDLTGLRWYGKPHRQQTVFALVHAPAAVDGSGINLRATAQGDLRRIVVALLPVEDIMPVPTSALRGLHVQGVQAGDVMLGVGWRNLDLPQNRRPLKSTSRRCGIGHGKNFSFLLMS